MTATCTGPECDRDIYNHTLELCASHTTQHRRTGRTWVINTRKGGPEKLDPAEDERRRRVVREMEGQSLNAVARHLGIGTTTLQVWLKDRGIHHVGPDEYRRREIPLMIAEGMTRAEMADVFGIGDTTLRDWCKRNGIDLSAAPVGRASGTDDGPTWGEIRTRVWELHAQGMARPEIAETVGIPLDRVHDALSWPAPRRLATVTDITTKRRAAA